MIRYAGVSAALVALAVLSGCNTMGRQPKLENASIEPSTLKPGDTAVITVKVIDKHRIVQRVVATIAEDQRSKFKLQDEGMPPDEKAGDGIWSHAVKVPFMAPPGNFTLELTAYDSKGDAISVKKGRKDVGPLTASVTWVIEYPPDAPPTEAAPQPAESAPPPPPPAPEPAK